MKRKLLLLSVMVICIAIAAAGTLAFFNGNATAHNVITTGKVAIKVNEYAKYDAADTTKRETYQTEQTGIMPGAKVDKIVVVSGEDGTADAWVRVKFVTKVTSADGKELDTSKIQLTTGTEWTYKDGWFYYNAPVKANQEAAPALLSVEFDATMDNTYQGATATVDVLAQAVQCANNGTSALTASGWPVDDPGTTTPTTPDPAPTNPGEGGLDTGKTG